MILLGWLNASYGRYLSLNIVDLTDIETGIVRQVGSYIACTDCLRPGQ
jgi:hypothetical protein